MVTMGYHKATQKRYYEKNKKMLNKKKAEYQKRMRRIARKALDEGYFKDEANS